MDTVDITPRCASGREIFVSSDGYLMPCCYSHRQLREVLKDPQKYSEKDRWFERNRDSFDLKKRTAKEILADPIWFDLAASWRNGTAPDVCYRICGVPRSSGLRHVDEFRRRDRPVTRLD